MFGKPVVAVRWQLTESTPPKIEDLRVRRRLFSQPGHN
jgi:hypothetical protein